MQNAILTGIELDVLAEQKKLSEPLQTMLEIDESLYGVDEVLAFSIVNIYGSIGFTNYGYIDKEKPGILKRLNDKSTGECHTFLDDIVGAISAAASSRLAHARGTQNKGTLLGRPFFKCMESIQSESQWRESVFPFRLSYALFSLRPCERAAYPYPR